MMVLLTFLLLSVILSGIGFVITVVIGGGVALMMLGDLFVFCMIVALILRVVRRFRCRKTSNSRLIRGGCWFGS